MADGGSDERTERPRLSAALITLDEAPDLPRVLEALRGLAGEIVVCDSGSTDSTVEIARSFGARVVTSAWRGFAAQKQHALEQCRGEWILSVDADEVPDSELRRALAALPEPGATAYSGFEVERLTAYQGRFIRHAWSPDRLIRVVRRGTGRFTDRSVHETLQVDGRVGRLPGRLLHYSYRDLAEHHAKLLAYARLGAEELDRRGRRSGPFGLFLRPLASFLKPYLLRRGFLDGTRGLLVSGSAAAATFFKYAYLYERQRDRAQDVDRESS